MTEASEFDKIYNLGVVPIPTNKPMVRVDQPDLVYRTEEAKFDAVVETSPSGTRRASRCSSAPCRWRSPSTSRQLDKRASATGPQRQAARRRGRSSRRPATRARSPSRPTWPVEAPTSCSAARWEFLADLELRKKGLEPTGETADGTSRLARRPSSGYKARSARRGHDGSGARRPLRHRHRAPRVAASTTSCGVARPSGRPGESRFYPRCRTS